jgi:hypothetical protein
MNRGTKKGAAKGGHIKKPKTEIWKWFSKLSLEERGNVLLWEDREGTCLLKQMYKKKATEGEGFFLSGDLPDLRRLCFFFNFDQEISPHRKFETVDDPALRKLNALARNNDPMLPPSENFCFTKFSNLDNYFWYVLGCRLINKLEEPHAFFTGIPRG